ERAGADGRRIAEDFRSAFLREKTAERRVTAADHDDPADRSVGTRCRFDDVEKRQWVGFRAANLARREHVTHPGPRPTRAPSPTSKNPRGSVSAPPISRGASM